MLKRNKPQRKVPVKIRSAGGAASQLVVLLSALYIKEVLHQDFVIEHYPYATGGYYPFALSELLRPQELSREPGKTKFFKPTGLEIPGKQLEGHPVSKSGLTYENLMKIIRVLRLEKFLSLLKFEWKLDFSIKRLEKTPQFARSIGGGFPPFRNKQVNEALRVRAKGTEISRVFETNISLYLENYIAIHYRLGDKRLAFDAPTVFGDGIIDPICFQRILKSLNHDPRTKVFVLSDEPDLAVKLLSDVGINATKNPIGSDFWSDLQLMISARILLCSWSTVTQFAICVADLEKTKVYYPERNNSGKRPNWKIPGVEMYEPAYLTKEHPVYSKNYSPEVKFYSIYSQEQS